MGTNIASLYKALYIRVKHFSEQHKNEKPQRPNSWWGCLYINHLSCPSFFCFIYWMVRIFSFDQPAKPAINSMHWHQKEKEKKIFHKIGITKQSGACVSREARNRRSINNKRKLYFCHVRSFHIHNLCPDPGPRGVSGLVPNISPLI